MLTYWLDCCSNVLIAVCLSCVVIFQWSHWKRSGHSVILCVPSNKFSVISMGVSLFLIWDKLHDVIFLTQTCGWCKWSCYCIVMLKDINEWYRYINDNINDKHLILMMFMPFHCSGSMEPAFHRGDLLFLTNRVEDPIRVGEIVVFRIEGREIPIVHRVLKVHEKYDLIYTSS